MASPKSVLAEMIAMDRCWASLSRLLLAVLLLGHMVVEAGDHHHGETLADRYGCAAQRGSR